MAATHDIKEYTSQQRYDALVKALRQQIEIYREKTLHRAPLRSPALQRSKAMEYLTELIKELRSETNNDIEALGRLISEAKGIIHLIKLAHKSNSFFSFCTSSNLANGLEDALKIPEIDAKLLQDNWRYKDAGFVELSKERQFPHDFNYQVKLSNK